MLMKWIPANTRSGRKRIDERLSAASNKLSILIKSPPTCYTMGTCAYMNPDEWDQDRGNWKCTECVSVAIQTHTLVVAHFWSDVLGSWNQLQVLHVFHHLVGEQDTQIFVSFILKELRSSGNSNQRLLIICLSFKASVCTKCTQSVDLVNKSLSDAFDYSPLGFYWVSDTIDALQTVAR